MAIRTNGAVLRQLQTLFDLGSIGDLTDGQLLARFTTGGGESAERAFAALVERHGPMVLRVCRNALADPNDAQDAFQATFLVLVRKARSLWVQDSLGPWLHRVAHRVAARVRASAARRREHERRAAESRPTPSPDGDDWQEFSRALHEEVDRLPERCRVPVVLCDLEGLTHEQAARRLSWPIGTVKSRLTRGREFLRSRLIRRGMAPAVGLLVLSSTTRSATAAVPAELVEATVKAARSIAAGAATTGAVPATVALLLEGALNAMFMTKMRLVLLACGLLATGAAVIAQQSGQAPEAETRLVQAGATKRPTPPSDEGDAIDTIVARDMENLDVELLREEVQLLKRQVQDAYRTKAHAERTGRTQRGEVLSLGGLEKVQGDYETLRASYRAKLRELAIASRHLEEDGPRLQAGRREPAASTPPNQDRAADREPPKTTSHLPAAVFGSIDMDAVMNRYAKVKELNQRGSDRDAEFQRQQATRRRIEVLKAQRDRLSPGTPEFNELDDKIAVLKEQIGTDMASVQVEFIRRQTRAMAALHHEIQQSISAVAKAKGMNYVVKVSPDPRSDSAPSDVETALKQSVLYADPHNDITEEVIRDLNRRFEAAGDKTTKEQVRPR